MSETPSLSLPVIAPAQAQKHVTHNDALMMLDALVQLSVISRSLTAPPATPGDGDRYLVPAAATGDWADHDHSIAAWHDGAWRFFPPQEGWRCVVVEEGRDIRFLHGRWRQGHAITSFGSALVFDAIAETHVLDAAVTSDTAIVIPQRSLLFGVTCLVTDPVTGPASFAVGVSGDAQRFGNGIGTGLNSQLNGPTQPIVYWADTPIRFTSPDVPFTGGSVQVSAHIARLQIPDFQ